MDELVSERGGGNNEGRGGATETVRANDKGGGEE